MRPNYVDNSSLIEIKDFIEKVLTAREERLWWCSTVYNISPSLPHLICVLVEYFHTDHITSHQIYLDYLLRTMWSVLTHRERGESDINTELG